jgi:hypothetical protein
MCTVILARFSAVHIFDVFLDSKKIYMFRVEIQLVPVPAMGKCGPLLPGVWIQAYRDSGRKGITFSRYLAYVGLGLYLWTRRVPPGDGWACWGREGSLFHRIITSPGRVIYQRILYAFPIEVNKTEATST